MNKLEAAEVAEAAEAKVKFYESFAALLIVWGSIPLNILVKTYVLSKMWAWFITPEYGVETPSLAILAGLLVMASYATMQRKQPTDSDGKLVTVTRNAVLYGAFVPSIMLLIAYIIHLFC